MSGNTARIQTYPDSVDVEEQSLKRLRGIAAEESVNNKRIYGLAIEFAIDCEDDFREFVLGEEGL